MDKNKECEPPDPFLGVPMQPRLSAFFHAHKKLVDDLSRFEPSALIASIAGLITMPEWQASTLRIEVLQHLAVASAKGKKKAKQADFKSWLVELGDGMAGRLEDPSEDVFVSRVLFAGQNFLIFEGLYEASAFYLQRFLNVLEAMPSFEPYSGIRRSVLALLCVSNEVARRAGVSAFQTGQTLPLQSVPNRLLRGISDAAQHVIFSPQDLKSLSVQAGDLKPFSFDPSARDKLRGETLGYSSLERNPVAWFRDYICLALPTAVTVAVRRLIIEFCISAEMQDALYKEYVNECARTFSRMPLLGEGAGPHIQFQRHKGIFVSNIVRYVDKGRLLHVCFVADSFDEYTETGLGRMPDPSRMSAAIRHSISNMHEEFSTKEDFRNAISLIVICPWGRPLYVEFESVKDPRWRVEEISAADLQTINGTPAFSPLSLWRLLDARDRLEQMDVYVHNFNGVLNLFAWSQSQHGHLIPHAQMSDNHNADMPLQVMIPHNALLAIRKSSAEAENLHSTRKWNGASVRVMREKRSVYFKEDQHSPLYVSLDDLDQNRLVAGLEAAESAWWVTIETPNLQDRHFHYRLWHALTVWLKRAAPVLEKSFPIRLGGPIVWLCQFDDTDPFDPMSPVLARDAARALMDITVEQNIICVHLKMGFLSSFRHATNVGESLLVEGLVRGVFTLNGIQPSPELIAEVMAQIVPEEWARDMHFFTAKTFRDFVRESVRQDPTLISEEDIAYSCLGLGWRARARAEGPRIYGIEECCTFLSRVIGSVWDEIRTELKKYTRESLILQLIENHESVMLEIHQWLSTAKAVLALHFDKQQTEIDSARQIAKLNASSLSTRLLIEMALCECPESGGIEAGELDTSRLLANVMRMHHLGGWSDAIKYGGKKHEIRITPLGDVHTDVDFDDRIVNPYGEALAIKSLRHGARSYEKNFREADIQESAQEAFPLEFWEAWIEAFGFSIDDLRKFMDNIDDEGLRREIFAFTCTFDELRAMDKAGHLPAPIIQNILDALSLAPRESWESTPAGFSKKDWFPWRFRRRLSLISRPIIQLTNDQIPRYLIAPGIVRTGAAKILQYCIEGGYDAKNFPPGKMRSWIGAAENKRGHDFNEKVSARLQELGWNTKPNIKLTEILNAKLDRDYGDIDVLAWQGQRILAIECKDLELAMTVGDMARQVHEFRGVDCLNSRPDRLKKHLVRIAVLKSQMDAVRRYTRSGDASMVEACLVFSDLVPMTFSKLADEQGVRISTFENLENI